MENVIIQIWNIVVGWKKCKRNLTTINIHFIRQWTDSDYSNQARYTKASCGTSTQIVLKIFGLYENNTFPIIVHCTSVSQNFLQQMWLYINTMNILITLATANSINRSLAIWLYFSIPNDHSCNWTSPTGIPVVSSNQRLKFVSQLR